MGERVIWAVGAIFSMVVLVQVARWWRYTLPRDRFVEGRVRRISDGDGLEIQFFFRGTRRVRLAYVDAPELNQPWGAEARDALSGLVGGVGGRVEVKAVDRDRHGRLIAEVRAGSVDVNATLVEEGHAWAYRKYIPDTLRSRYVEAETLAEQSWKGLWRPVRPTAPWKWRRGARESVPAALGGPIASPSWSGNGADAGARPRDRR